MTTHSNSKINQLLLNWPHGTIATQRWLSEKGFSRFLIRVYVKGGWVKPLGHGAFSRADDGDKPSWVGALYAVQNQLHLPVHLGAQTALEWQGYGHTVAMGAGAPLYFFSPKGVKPPAWFLRYPWDRPIRHQTTDFLSTEKEAGLVQDGQKGFPLLLSAPERAILEALLLTPKYFSFEEARHLMEGLTTLRPALVQKLLEACGSVKVKRAFLYLAEDTGHSWFKELDVSKLDLGKGKRVIVPGGTFDSKYQITILEENERNVP